MHRELIGQTASLSLPRGVDAAPLLLSFVEELIEANGGATDDLEALKNDLVEAVGAIRRHDGADDECHVVAAFEIHGDSIHIRLTCDTHDAPDVRQVVVARES